MCIYRKRQKEAITIDQVAVTPGSELKLQENEKNLENANHVNDKGDKIDSSANYKSQTNLVAAQEGM